MRKKISIPELTYELRLLARHEQRDAPKATMFLACGLLEHIDDVCKLVEMFETREDPDDDGMVPVPTEILDMLLEIRGQIGGIFRLGDPGECLERPAHPAGDPAVAPDTEG